VLRVFLVRVLKGVSLLCDALRLLPAALRRRVVVSAARDLSATPTTQMVSVRCVVSDARCPSITSMVQCRCRVLADLCGSITPARPRAGFPSSGSCRLFPVIAVLGSR
jgi:hypothetical protein